MTTTPRRRPVASAAAARAVRPSWRVRLTVWALAGVMLLSSLGMGAVGLAGCSRNLNERSAEERLHAATHFRTQADYDVANGRLVQAVGNYMEAVRILPSDAPSYWGLARIYHTLGFDGRAAVMATKARQHDPQAYEGRAIEPIPVDDPATLTAALTPRPVPDDADYVRPPASRP